MDEKIQFEVPGTPKPKGRPRFARVVKFTKVYTPLETEIIESDIKCCYYNKYGFNKELLTGDVNVFVIFYMPIPKSLSQKKKDTLKGLPHTKKPDLDNLMKAVLDAINGVIYQDDSQVYRFSCVKLYSDKPRTYISIQQ
jgi:Holliday junction resolvase RusA-like endonuclease